MRLYLVRHGKAMSKTESPQRSLSEEGKREVERVASLLGPLGLAVDTVYHSGKARAIETAQVLAKSLDVKNGIKQKDGLNPNDDPATIAKWVNGRKGDLMLVGHLPFMQLMASLLLAGDQNEVAVAFEAAGTMCLEHTQEKNWALIWMVVPSLLSER